MDERLDWSEDIRVYVAGPLFGSGRSTANVHKALLMAMELHEAGFFPFVPHLFHFWDTVFPNDDADYWLNMDRIWLKQCHVMVRLPGVSPGSTKEEGWCLEFGIPVVPVVNPADAVRQVRNHVDYQRGHGR